MSLGFITSPPDSQRIYRGGSQWHDHFKEDRHTGPKLHDGYWRHYHDDGGMVAVEEECRNDLADELTGIASQLISLSNTLREPE